MKKSKFLLLFLVILLLASILPMQALALEEPTISAASAILINADDGEVFYELEADEQRAPASTTKIMTALLVIEAVENGQFTMEDSVAAYDDCQTGMDEDSSNSNPTITPGEVLSVRDLLYCALLNSANEACNILAEYTSGSISGFVDAMNARAEELGCTNTHFNNPNGLEDANNYSSARDMALIAKECVSHDSFVEICSTINYTIGATNINAERALANSNALMDANSVYYDADVYGIKTGYFENAGGCLVAGIERNDINLISVILGDVEVDGVDYRYTDTLTLFNWFYENFSYIQVLSSTESVIKVPVALATAETVSGRPDTSLNVLLPNDFDMETVDYAYVIYSERDNDNLVAPVNAGTILGEVTVSSGDRIFGTVNIVASHTAELSKSVYLKNSIKSILQQPIVRKLLTILIIVVAIYIILSFCYVVQHSRHKRSMRRARQQWAEEQAIQETFSDVEIREDAAEDDDIGRGGSKFGSINLQPWIGKVSGIFSRRKDDYYDENEYKDEYEDDDQEA